MKVKTHKRRIFFPIFGIAVAILVGGTFAVNHDFSIFENQFQLATDTAEFVDTFESPEEWTPCEETPKTAIATNKNDTPRYVRMKIDDYWRLKNSQISDDDHTTSELDKTWTDDQNIVHSYAEINFQNEEDWAHAQDGWYYFRNPIAKDESTSSLLESVTFNCEVNLSGEVVYSADGKVGVSGDNDYADAKYHVYVTFQMRAEEWDYEEIPDNIVARIERTGKLYGSIMAAHAKAEAGDTITLLVDTEETVTNEKQVTLDLNGHTVIGSLTNNGNLTLINGEIRNPDGAAVTNNSILTLGVNDYDQDTGVALIDNENVRLIGTTAGIVQTNNTYQLYYYDGYLEGDVGLVGGYDGAPMYHSYADVQDVYFWPYVYNRQTADQHAYQHVELRSADNAVSKTSVHGDIYYMDFQNNIDSSATTGYTIYAVSDYPTFSASYNITVPENTNILFDLVGHNIRLNNLIIFNGNMTIIDSQSTVDPDSCAKTYAGGIAIQQPITGNGSLTIENTRISNTVNSNTLLKFDGALTMRGSTLSTNDGYVVDVMNNSSYSLDKCSVITGYRGNTIHNTTSDFVWDTGGLVYSQGGNAIQNTANSKFTLKNGTIQTDSGNAIDSNYQNTTVIIDGGTIKTGNIGIFSGDITMNGGTILGSHSRSVTGIFMADNYNLTMNGGEINVNSTSGYAIGVDASHYSNGGTMTYNHGSIIATAAGDARGIYSRAPSYINNSDFTISAISTRANGFGVTQQVNNTFTIKAGNIYGSTYGAYSERATGVIVIGDASTEITKDTPIVAGGSYGIYGSNFRFYDGTLKGNTDSYNHQNSPIQAIPDGSALHDDTDAEYDYATWLVNSENYLHVVGGDDYNSLAAAYAAITGDTGTIEVTKNFTTESLLASSPENKTITFDLKGFELTYAQSLTVSKNSTFIFQDSVGGGALHNSTTTNNTIVNHGTLNILSGTIDNKRSTVYSSTVADGGNATVNISGGLIKCTIICVYEVGYYNHPANINMSGGEIAITEAANETQIGIYHSQPANVNITGGLIHIERNTGSNAVYVIHGAINNGGAVTINAPADQTVIKVDVPAGEVRGTFCGTNTLKSGIIDIKTSGEALGLNPQGGGSKLQGGTINVTNTGDASNTSKAYGAYGSFSEVSGNTVINVSSNAGDAYGIFHDDIYTTNNFTSGTITATSASGTGIGFFSGNGKVVITGGKIEGSTYGMTGTSRYQETRFAKIIGSDDGTVGTSSPEIIGGTYALSGYIFHFFDGVLRSNNSNGEAVASGTIQQIPSGYTYAYDRNHSTSAYEVSVWLKQEVEYLSVDGQPYNNLADAYNAITGDTGTIKVIADVVVNASLPNFPANKNITFDINGHQLTYSNAITINSGASSVLNIIDSDPDGTGTGYLHNSSQNTNTIYVYAGTVNIQSGKVSSSNNTTINAGYASTLNVSGGTIECNVTCIYFDRSNVIITGGLINVKDNGGSEQVAISGDSSGNQGASITGGQIRIVRDANSTNTSRAVAIGSSKTTVNVSSNTPVVYIENPTGEAVAIGENINNTVQAGNFSVSGLNAYGFKDTDYGDNVNCNINGGTFTVNGSDTANAFFGGPCTIRNVNATATATNGNAYGIHLYDHRDVNGHHPYTETVTGGTISATSTNGNAYGIYTHSFRGTLNVSGGSISSSAPNGTSYGIMTDSEKLATINLTGGEIVGGDYGIYASSVGGSYSTFTLGTNDSTIDTSTPIVRGGNYGTFNGHINFYDGKIMGGNYAYNDVRYIKYAPSNAIIYQDSETISGVTYDTRYLTIVTEVAKIGSTKYDSLSDAITAAGTGDTIELLKDNYLFYNLVIPSGKDFTLETAGFNIITGNQIVNNGAVTIEAPSTGTNPTFSFVEMPYFIVNNADASLTLKNVSLNTKNGIDNKGTLVANNTSVVATGTAVKNTGPSVTIDSGSLLSGGSHALYNDGTLTSLDNVSVIDGDIYNNSGKVTMNDLTAVITRSASDENLDYALYNAAGNDMEISNSDISYTNNRRTYGSHGLVYNANNLTISGSVLNFDGDYTNYIIYNNGSATTTISGSDLSITSPEYDIYGIYNPSGTVTITSGSVTASDTGNRTAYGVYTNTGSITFGEAEPTTSPDYGQPTAHVDNTNPSILATGGGNSTGVYFGNGHVYFYDGILTGTGSAINKDPSVIEHLWKTKSGTDANNRHYMIQEFAQ